MSYLRNRLPMLGVGVVLVLALLLAMVLAGCASQSATGNASTGSGSAAQGAGSAAAPAADLAPARQATDLPVVRVVELPPEGVETLELIASDGPFPYSRDGVTFENRERILPKQPTGFYHEFTVPTPGESDRGARRIVTGEDGSRFYTADHYDSFEEVVAQ